MTAFTVWKYDDAEGAAHATTILERAAEDGLVRILDHAVVSWPAGAGTPSVKHTRDDTRRGAGWGALWGVVAGAMFAVPVAGAAAGAAAGALVKAKQGLGITGADLDRIRSEVTEGTSALFLVTEQADLDRLAERMRGVPARLVEANLTDAERAVLLEAVGHR